MYGVVVGKIGRIETKYVGESFLLNLSVAEKRYDSKSKERKTTWYGVSFWGKRAEGIANYLKKGMDISVFGQDFMEEYNGKSYLKINADDIIMQGHGGTEGESQPHQNNFKQNSNQQSHKEYETHQGGNDPFFDDDIPF